jgi:hypothetical protein
MIAISGAITQIPLRNHPNSGATTTHISASVCLMEKMVCLISYKKYIKRSFLSPELYHHGTLFSLEKILK